MAEPESQRCGTCWEQYRACQAGAVLEFGSQVLVATAAAAIAASQVATSALAFQVWTAYFAAPLVTEASLRLSQAFRQCRQERDDCVFGCAPRPDILGADGMLREFQKMAKDPSRDAGALAWLSRIYAESTFESVLFDRLATVPEDFSTVLRIAQLFKSGVAIRP